MLCITMEPRIAKQYKCTTVLVAKITRERAWRVEEKKSLHCFSADQKIASLWKKCVLGHPKHEQQVIACCQTHFDYGPPKCL